MYTRAVFAIIFRERYNYIAESVKVSCGACKPPFWANVDISESGNGGAYWEGVRFWRIRLRQLKILNFVNFLFSMSYLPFWVYFLKFFCCRFLGTGVFWVFCGFFVRGVVFMGIFAGVLGLYIFISPSRWRTGYRGVIKVALLFFGGILGCFLLGKVFLLNIRVGYNVIFAVFGAK